MLAQVILQGNGPLPLKATFQFESTDPAAVLISASAFSNAPARALGVELAIDGGIVAGAGVFANEPASHKTLVSPLSTIAPGFGSHQVVLDVAIQGTVTDANDSFTVTLIY